MKILSRFIKNENDEMESYVRDTMRFIIGQVDWNLIGFITVQSKQVFGGGAIVLEVIYDNRMVNKDNPELVNSIIINISPRFKHAKVFNRIPFTKYYIVNRKKLVVTLCRVLSDLLKSVSNTDFYRSTLSAYSHDPDYIIKLVRR